MSLLPLAQDSLLEDTQTKSNKSGKIGKLVLSDGAVPTLFAPLPQSKKNKILVVEKEKEMDDVDLSVYIGKKKKVV